MKLKHIKNKHYTKGQAFNKTYSKVKTRKEIPNGYERAKSYHHDPKKLDIFKHYTNYQSWSGELYSSSTNLNNLLRTIYNKASQASSLWYKKNQLDYILDEYYELQPDLKDLYDDIAEFQKCFLATDIRGKSDEIILLSDQIKHLTTFERNIVETCNQKFSEISSTRLSITNLVIASIAIIISVLVFFITNN